MYVSWAAASPGWTGNDTVDMSIPVFQESVPEINADPTSG